MISSSFEYFWCIELITWCNPTNNRFFIKIKMKCWKSKQSLKLQGWRCERAKVYFFQIKNSFSVFPFILFRTWCPSQQTFILFWKLYTKYITYYFSTRHAYSSSVIYNLKRKPAIVIAEVVTRRHIYVINHSSCMWNVVILFYELSYHYTAQTIIAMWLKRCIIRRHRSLLRSVAFWLRTIIQIHNFKRTTPNPQKTST